MGGEVAAGMEKRSLGGSRALAVARGVPLDNGLVRHSPDSGAAAQAPLLVVQLAGHEFALPLEPVREVIRMVAVTPVVGAPIWVPGVVDLRGTTVPMVDLRARLGLPVIEADPAHMFVVVEFAGRLVGLIVDRAVDVISVDQTDIAAGETSSGQGLAAGVARSGSRLLVLLDLDAVSGGVTADPGR